MSFKHKMYDILVRRKPVIKKCYVSYKNKHSSFVKRMFYLFRLNFSYYILRNKKLSGYSRVVALYPDGSESSLSYREPPVKLADKLSEYQAVSFDIFDTLIYRPFANPTDLFHIVGARTGLLNFADVRAGCEFRARQEKHKSSGTYEIDIDEIYDAVNYFAGSSFVFAKQYELEAESELCYANPYMKEVWDILKSRKIRLVVTSDMYLKREFLEELLRKNGFDGYEKLFVSNEYAKSKHEGDLYDIVREYLACEKIAHVGDNMKSDVTSAEKHKFKGFLYLNSDFVGNNYRPEHMSRLIGSAYSGLVNNKLHCGMESYSMLYEYGYVYSGIFVLGFCRYIHELQAKTGADKILFLARDGDLLKKVYDKLYPGSPTYYFLWSRLAAVKLCAGENILDFVRRFVYHKSNGKYTAGKIFREMGLEHLLEGFEPGDVIIDGKNVDKIEKYLLDNVDKVAEGYKPDTRGAKRYFAQMLGGSRKALAVDVGWAGSGGVAIGRLADEWGFGTEIIGVIAGTNTETNDQPDASEALLQCGKMYSYCFSQRHNRHIYEAHDAAAGHNIFFEMLLGSESPSLKGFKENGEPVFSPNEKDNAETVRLIHKGACDFVDDYMAHFGNIPFMLDITGSDAYAPFLTAVFDGNVYFRAVLGSCSFNASVGEGNEDDTVNSQL